jgi:hypothetical protein
MTVGGSKRGNKSNASTTGRPAHAVTANQRASDKPTGSKTKVVKTANVRET